MADTATSVKQPQKKQFTIIPSATVIETR